MPENQVFTDEQIEEIISIFTQHMGHRQYIGARYVPIFGRKDEETIEWDNSAPYEPLTIVLHQGDSYTSRQYVPTGVDITNNAFWALTGNYNAQIEAYRQQVEQFDSRISTNTQDIASLDEELEETAGNLSDAISDEETARIEAVRQLGEAMEDADNALDVKIGEFSKIAYPSYIGDIAIPKLHDNGPQLSATCQDGNGNIYVATPNNYDGKGEIYIFNPTGTLLRKVENAPIGHANSIVWVEDSNKIVISLLNTSSGGTEAPSTNIVEVTPVTGTYTVKDIGTRYYGMSYDHVGKKLYGIEMHTGDTDVILYELNPTTYARVRTVCTLTHPNSHNFGQATIPQDAAVNDGILYVLYTEGTCYYEQIRETEETVTMGNSVKFITENELWIMGEAEAIEFSPNGELLGACNYYLNSLTAGFVVSWSLNGHLDVLPFPNYSLHGTCYLANRTSLQPVNYYTFPSIEYLEISKMTGVGTLQVNSGTTFTEPGTAYPHRVTKNVELYVIGTYNCFGIEAINGIFYLRVAASGIFSSTNAAYAISNASRNTILSVDNRGTINSAGASFITTGYNKAPITFGSMSTSGLKINNNAITPNSLYIGDGKAASSTEYPYGA